MVRDERLGELIVFTDNVKPSSIRNENFGLKKLFKELFLFKRTFNVIKIGLYRSGVSHFSFEIFVFV